MTASRTERVVAVGLVVGWVCLAATARWSWRFILGSHS